MDSPPESPESPGRNRRSPGSASPPRNPAHQEGPPHYNPTRHGAPWPVQEDLENHRPTQVDNRLSPFCGWGGPPSPMNWAVREEEAIVRAFDQLWGAELRNTVEGPGDPLNGMNYTFMTCQESPFVPRANWPAPDTTGLVPAVYIGRRVIPRRFMIDEPDIRRMIRLTYVPDDETIRMEFPGERGNIESTVIGKYRVLFLDTNSMVRKISEKIDMLVHDPHRGLAANALSLLHGRLTRLERYIIR
jgi:hypothetical protein